MEGRIMAPSPVQQPAAKTAESVEERFQRLAAVWHRDTDFLSSMSEADSHPAYQEIIRMGPDVLPFLLRDLQTNHTHWFGALSAITGADPVQAEAGGNVPAMAAAWLRWAKDHGYRW
jgi:hypothetical protein